MPELGGQEFECTVHLVISRTTKKWLSLIQSSHLAFISLCGFRAVFLPESSVSALMTCYDSYRLLCVIGRWFWGVVALNVTQSLGASQMSQVKGISPRDF